MNKKKGYISLEAIFIVAMTMFIGTIIFINFKDSTKDEMNEIGDAIADKESYMGENVARHYNSTYTGVGNQDEGWSDDPSHNQGSFVPVYNLVTDIRTDKQSYDLRVGEELKDLHVSVFPSDASKSQLSWRVLSGKDKTIINRDESGHTATITAVKAGKTAIKIAATDGSGIDSTIFVNVTQPVTGITLNKENQTIALSLSGTKSVTVKATVLPDKGDSIAPNQRITWSFGNAGANSECVSMVPNNNTNEVTVTALNNYCNGGKAMITATTDDGSFTKSFYVYVVE